jgi:hypothetical protein
MNTLQLQSPVTSTASSASTGSGYGYLRSGDWVRLPELPSAYSYDEALLLCEIGAGEWLAWVPDFGELLINVG